MTIASAFNDITEKLGGTPSNSGTIASAIDALNDVLAGSDQPAVQTIEGAVALLGEHIGGGSSVTVEALTATENKIYTAPEGKAYSPVTVNVAGGAAWGAPIPVKVSYPSDAQYLTTDIAVFDHEPPFGDDDVPFYFTFTYSTSPLAYIPSGLWMVVYREDTEVTAIKLDGVAFTDYTTIDEGIILQVPAPSDDPLTCLEIDVQGLG